MKSFRIKNIRTGVNEGVYNSETGDDAIKTMLDASDCSHVSSSNFMATEVEVEEEVWEEEEVEEPKSPRIGVVQYDDQESTKGGADALSIFYIGNTVKIQNTEFFIQDADTNNLMGSIRLTLVSK